MRVYVILFFTLLFSLATHAAVNDEHEVKVVGDKNYNNNSLVYDGIDVSNYQKDINWRAAAEDPSIKYVYVKATEGATHKQHRYRANIENARKHGVKVGSYHFLSTTSPIQKQFENFISMARPEEQDLIPLLDVETHAGWNAKQLQDSVKLFCSLLEDYYGCKPMIYTNVSYFNTLLGYDFRNYPLFIARYSKNEPQLNFGAKWILWQFSDCGIINGIDAKVDLSRFNRGCSLKDITYRATKSRKKKNDRQRENVPRPKPKKEDTKQEVPYPPANRNNQNNKKEKTEAQKRGEENAKKRQKMEEKKREEERKAQEKARKEEEKKRKEIEKREKEIEKKRAEQEKKRLEQEEKQRKQEEKQRKEEEKRRKDEEKRKARDNAQARMKADKDKGSTTLNDQNNQIDDEQKRRNDLMSVQQERLASEKSKEMSSADNKKTGKKTTKKVSNQSSADNDEIKYNRGGKK